VCQEYYVLRTLESTFEHYARAVVARCSGDRTDNFRDEYSRVRVRNMTMRLTMRMPRVERLRRARADDGFGDSR